jgi:ribosomal protein S18 acetylase RimI-like enzyme
MIPEDLPELLEVIKRVEANPRLDLDYLRYRSFGDATTAPDLLLVARQGPESEPLGTGAARAPGSGHVDNAHIVGYCLACVHGERGVIKLFGVDESYRRKGIGTALFDAIEPRLWARQVNVIAVEGASPGYFTPGVELTHTETVTFLVHRGYETNRESRVDMQVDLLHSNLETATDEARLAKLGIAIRRAQPEEIETVAQFALANFSAAWQQEVRDAAMFSPAPLFVAWEGDQVVSFAAYDVGGPARFGPTGTHPSQRRRGVGGVLLKQCLRSIRDRGEPYAEIAWVGPIQFYADAVGARIHRVYWLFRKQIAPTR